MTIPRGYIPGKSSDLSDLTELKVDNIKLDGNTISSTDTNGNINLDPNGSGNIQNILTSNSYHLLDLNNGGTGSDLRTSKWYVDSTYIYNDVYRATQLHRLLYGTYVLQIMSASRGGLNVGTGDASIFSVNALNAVLDAQGTGKAKVLTATNDIELTPNGGNVNITVNGLEMAGTLRITSGGGFIVQANTTANRPGSPLTGQIFFDTDLARVIVYNGSAWVNMDGTALS